MARLDRRPARSGRSRSVIVQPLLLTSQSTNAPTASGSDSSILHSTILPQSLYGRGTGSATTVGRPGGLVAERAERHVLGLAPVVAALHERRERGVDRLLDRRDAAEARRQVNDLGAARRRAGA